MMLKHLQFKTLFIFLIVFCVFSNVFSQQKSLRFLDPKKKLTQYPLDHWATDTGLPSNNIRRVIQSKTGYLWLAGFDGLINFDGVRFNLFNKRVIPKLKSNAIFLVEEDSNGTLWLGSEGSGLFTLKNDLFVQKDIFKDWFMTALFIEDGDKFLIGGRGKGIHIYNPSKNTSQPIKEIPSATTIYVIRKDKKGNIWFGTDNNGIFIKNQNSNQIKQLHKKDGLISENVNEIFFDNQNRIWAGTTEGVCLWNEEKQSFEAIKELEGHIAYRIIEDDAKNIWFATAAGLFRLNPLTQKYERLPDTPFLPLTNMVDLCLDREGSLWIASYRNGLFRLKDGKFTNYTVQDGLSTTSVGAVYQDNSNKFIVGMNDGVINIIENGVVSVLKIKTQLPEIRIFNIQKDKKGNLWICTFKGLLKISPNGQETFFNKDTGFPDNSMRVTFIDNDDNIWVGTRRGGIAKINSDGKILKIYNNKNGLSSNFIMSIKQGVNNSILVGTNDNGICIITPDDKIQRYDINKGLPSNLVFSSYVDGNNVVWLATNAGLVRWKDDNFYTFSNKQGMLNDSPFDIIEDNRGYLWLSTAQGLISVYKPDLNNFIQGKIKNIVWRHYDERDGMKSEDCTGAAHSIKTKEGTIWVPTNGGIVVIDPANMPFNYLKPPVQINKLVIDGKLIDIHHTIEIAPDQKRYVFDFSALSLLAPSRVQFKYKLDGFDRDWQDGGTIRQVTYTNLRPGKYVFKVIASNNDGIWNEVGQSLILVKKPYFYETIWFLLLSVLVLIVLVFLLIKWRLHRIERQKEKLEYLVKQKTSEVFEQNIALEKQKNKLDSQNLNLTNSINYAKRIQEAILPPKEEIQIHLPDFFIFYQPRDIVSGDFYWFTETRGKIMMAAIDCTGHGVPGAFMSMIGNDLLNEVVNVRNITDADHILNYLHRGVNHTLKQNDAFGANRDGMDMTICVIDKKEKQVQFAGAKNPLFYWQNGQLNEIKGDKLPIGGHTMRWETERTFTKHIISIETETIFYMFSDGYQDQFGGEINKKFGRMRMRELIKAHNDLPLEKQKEYFQTAFFEWKGQEEQIDDILLVGFRVG